MKTYAYFDNIHKHILQELNQTTFDVTAAIAWFTDKDIYDLLCKKNLRGFLAFERLKANIHSAPEAIFFAAASASFRGDFIGFEQALQSAPSVAKPSGRLFFKRRFFTELPEIELSSIEYSLGGKR